MITLIKNNERTFNINIINVLKENPKLLGLDNDAYNFLAEKLLSNQEIKIVNDNELSPKENYDILLDSNIYIGNIILPYNETTDFWEIDLLIFPDFRRFGYAKLALEQLINSVPNRKWEANILKQNPKLTILESYLSGLGFEKVDDGLLNSFGEIVFNYKKASEIAITVIGSSYFAPITDLLCNLLKRSTGKYNELQTSQMENGYSVSLCILLIACFESYIMRDYYFRKESVRIPVLKFLKENFISFPYLQEITECYLIRDLLMHNHIWEIEHSYLELKVINSELMPFSGDSKFSDNIDLGNKVTKKLKLNIIPIKINRKDVKIILHTIWQSLNFLSHSKDSQIILTYIPVFFDGQITNFNDVYNKFIEAV